MDPTQSPSPAELDGFTKFFTEEHVGLVMFLLRHGARFEDARDAAQESFIRALRHWGTIDNPRTWIRTTAVRLYHRQVRRDAREVPVDMRGDWHPAWIFAELDHAEEGRHVLVLLRALPVRQREVMAWRYDGYATREIAEFIGITDDAVRASLYQARRRLRRRLGGTGQPEGGRE